MNMNEFGYEYFCGYEYKNDYNYEHRNIHEVKVINRMFSLINNAVGWGVAGDSRNVAGDRAHTQQMV